MYFSNSGMSEIFAAGTARKKQTNACGYADKPKTRAASNKLGPGAVASCRRWLFTVRMNQAAAGTTPESQ